RGAELGAGSIAHHEARAHEIGPQHDRPAKGLQPVLADFDAKAAPAQILAIHLPLHRRRLCEQDERRRQMRHLWPSLKTRGFGTETRSVARDAELFNRVTPVLKVGEV